MKQYDLIALGSGGVTKISTPAANAGHKVALIEKERPGGTCLNRGCIPSKMLIHPADVAVAIREAHKFNIQNNTEFSVNFRDLITRISKTIDTDSEKITANYERNPNLDYYHGEGKFINNNTIEVNGEELAADKIIIGVGSRPQIPPIEGLADTPFMTSTEALRNTKLPKRLIVIGASYIATELGHAYGAFGCEVHFLVRSRLLRKEDSQISEEFTRVFSERYNVHIGAVPTKVEFHDQVFNITYIQDDQQFHLTADALLVATGVVPNTDTLLLENTDITHDEQGFIQVDHHLETTVKGIYALGDCIGRYFFRHSVNFEGEYLWRTLFTDAAKRPIKYPPIPHAIFTHPQVASIGKTEDELQNEGTDYVVGLNPYRSSAMGMARLSDHGFCKILIDRNNQLILGAHIIGDEASNMLHMLIALMTKNGTLDDLLNMVYIHPALPEIVRNAARKAKAELDK